MRRAHPIIGRAWQPFAVLAALVLGCALPARGQAPLAPLHYRRVFVPAEELESQIRGLLPLKRSEFERLLQEFEGRSASGGGPAAPRIERIACRAHLEGNELRQGVAEITVALTGGPASLSLAPLSLIVESAAWLGEPSLPAILGTNRQGELACWVERSGVLRLQFSQRAKEARGGEARFDLLFPAAPRGDFEVAAPSGVVIGAQPGLVRPAAAGQAPASSQTWMIELAGASQVRLVARPARQAAAPRPRVREQSSYAPASSTIDLRTTLTLDLAEHAAGEIELAATEGLKILAVSLPAPEGDERLQHKQLAGGEPGTRHMVVLPQRLAGTTCEVRIEATADWRSEKPARLPRLWVNGGIYEQGEATIHSPAWLKLAARPLQGCDQVHVAPAAEGRGGWEFHFQLYEANAEIEIQSDQRQLELQELSGTQIQVDAHQVTGSLVALLSAKGGERFSVSAEIPVHWIVDAIEAEPAAMVLDRSLTNEPGGKRRLLLNLASPLTVDRPLRVRLRAHVRRPPTGTALSEDYFRLARFTDVEEARRLIDLAMLDAGWRLRLPDERPMSTLAADQLTAQERELFETPPGNTLLVATRPTGGFAATIVPARAQFQAELLVQARHEAGRVQQSVAIDCRPSSSAVNTLLVHVAPAPRGEIEWRLTGQENQIVVPSSESSDKASGAVYRLSLARSFTTAFQVRGEWSADFLPDERISLAWVEGAEAQTARAEVYAADGGALLAEAEHADPLPLVPAPEEERAALRARYRYESGPRAAIRVREAPRAALPAAWIERLSIESRISLGSVQHEARLTIANQGESVLRVRLPAEATEIRLWQEGSRAETSLSLGINREAALPLPPGQSRVRLGLRYRTAAPVMQFGSWGRVALPLPEFAWPVRERAWAAYLAPELATNHPGAAPKPEERLSPEADVAGWTRLELPPPSHAQFELNVYRPAPVLITLLCVGLMALLAVERLRSASIRLILSGGMFAAAALLGTTPIATLLMAAGWGMLAGCLLKLARPRLPVQRTAVVPAATALTVAVMAEMFFAAPLVAQPVALSGATANQPSQSIVVIAIDEKRQPVGDYVFLSSAFYDTLQARTTGDHLEMQYFLEAAKYELPAAVRSDGTSASIDELRASFDLHTLQDDTPVELPIARTEISLLENRARLDGRPVELHWQEEGRALAFRVPVSGKHRFEFAAAAVATPSAEGIVLDLTIPKAARTVASFPPAADPQIQVGPSPGELSSSPSSSAPHVLLGPAGRLVVRWPVARTAEARRGGPAAEQLLLWTIRPSGVFLEGRFRLKNVASQSKQAVIAFDPRLRLVPTEGEPAARVVPGRPSQVIVELPDSSQEEAEVRLAWQWSEKLGTGTLRLPRIELKADRVERAWTAVTLEPPLELTATEGTMVRLPVADFAQAWQGAPPLAAAVRGLASEFDLRAVVRPALQLPTAAPTIDWTISATESRAEFRVKLADVPRNRFEYRVRVPELAKIVRIELYEGERTAAVQWTRSDDHFAVVTLLEPPATSQELFIEVLLPLGGQQGKFALPGLGIEKVRPGRAIARLYREASLNLNIPVVAEWAEQDDAEVGTYRAGFGRLAAVLTASAASDSATQLAIANLLLECTTTDAKLQGTMLTRLHEGEGEWRAVVDFDLSLASGSLDELHLLVPSDWPGPYEATGASIEEVRPFGSAAEKRLIVRPHLPAIDHLRLSISGKIVPPAQGIRAPNIRLADRAGVQRFVLLPRLAGLSHLDWQLRDAQTSGFEMAQLPAGWSAEEGELAVVTGPSFEAVARVRPEKRRTLSAFSADVQMRLERSGRFSAEARFLIQPAGARELTVTMPPDCRIIQVLIDDRIAQCLPSGVRQWRFNTVSNELPFKLAILYEGTALANGSAQWQREAPSVEGLAIERMIWSLSPAEGFRAAAPARAIDQEQKVLIELEAIAAALAGVAGAQAREIPESDLAMRFKFLRQLYWESASGMSEIDKQEDTSVRERRRELDQTLARLEQRLGVVADQAAVAVAPPEPQLALAVAAARSIFDAPGNRLVLTPHFPQESTSSSRRGTTWSRLTGWPAALAASALALAVALQSRAIGGWCSARRPLLLAACGVLWWLFAPLGWMGLLFVALAIWQSLQWIWRRPTFEHGSTMYRHLPASAK